MGTLKGEGRDRRGCQLEGVRVRGAIASRGGVRSDGGGILRKVPSPTRKRATFPCCWVQCTSSSVSRDVYQRSRRGRKWRCEPNEVVTDVRSEEGRVESCPQSTPSKGMVVVQIQEGCRKERNLECSNEVRIYSSIFVLFELTHDNISLLVSRVMRKRALSSYTPLNSQK